MVAVATRLNCCSVQLGKVAMVAARGRVRSFSWGKEANQVLLALHDNSLAVYNVAGETGKKVSTLERYGHRSGECLNSTLTLPKSTAQVNLFCILFVYSIQTNVTIDGYAVEMNS